MIISKNKAFLLIEVLITVTVVAVAIIFINHAFTSSLKAVSLSNSYSEAVLFFENKTLDLELALNSERVDLSSFKEEIGFADAGFQLKSQMLPLVSEDIGDEYDQEDLEIERFASSLTWQARGLARKIDIVTYVPIDIENEEE